MKKINLSVLALGLMLFSTSCKKEETITPNSTKVSYKFDKNEWIIENSKYRNSEGVVGVLYHSKYDINTKYFAPANINDKSAWTGTFSKQILEYEPGAWVLIYHCDGEPKNCRYDKDGNLIVHIE